MSKFCARCSKAVYTIEELKCLDKVWHKGCFKCETCGMTLNMRNYKGFEKHPYCEAHVPKVKPTTMAETPELRRIAENTKIQSNVKYHEDFEKSKGKFTQVVDDPEIKRIQQNSKIISNVAYHGDLEKKAAMEQKRNHNDNFNSAPNFDPNYSFQNNIPEADNSNRNNTMQRMYLPQQQPPPSLPTQIGAGAHSFENVEHNSNAQNNNINLQLHYQQQQRQQQLNHYHQQQLQQQQQQQQQQQLLHQQQLLQQQSMKKPNQAVDISHNSPYSSQRNSSVVYTPDLKQGANGEMMSNSSISGMDQRTNIYGSINNFSNGDPSKANSNALTYNGRVYRAMYDYEAQDDDEVSFRDGDVIVNVSNIRAGWMTGQVHRTGEIGMLPANYVELMRI